MRGFHSQSPNIALCFERKQDCTQVQDIIRFICQQHNDHNYLSVYLLEGKKTKQNPQISQKYCDFPVNSLQIMTSARKDTQLIPRCVVESIKTLYFKSVSLWTLWNALVQMKPPSKCQSLNCCLSRRYGCHVCIVWRTKLNRPIRWNTIQQQCNVWFFSPIYNNNYSY